MPHTDTTALDERFRALHAAIASPPNDMPLEHWRPLYDEAVEFGPDLILELGRGWGNSTSIFTEAADRVGAHVVSIDFDGESLWRTKTAPKLRRLVPSSWFEPLTVLEQDIMETDFRPILRNAQAVLVFWDAHGDALARDLITRLLPALPARNRVVVHDVWDDHTPVPTYVADERIFSAGPLRSHFSEIAAIWEVLRPTGYDHMGAPWISFEAPIAFLDGSGTR
jgi:predicted O-methyltransferase YrrM